MAPLLWGPPVTHISPLQIRPSPTPCPASRRPPPPPPSSSSSSSSSSFFFIFRGRQARNRSMVEASLQHCIKLLCSYDGKIVPRHTDARLRYVGGHTRLLSLPRSVPFPELIAKLSVLYGSPVSLRCQLPSEDLDALVSITSDDDFANLLEEYDKAAVATPKIRAFLFPVRPKTPSPPSSATSPPAAGAACRPPLSVRCVHHAVWFPLRPEKFAGEQRRMAAKPPLVQGSCRKNSGYASPFACKGNPWQ